MKPSRTISILCTALSLFFVSILAISAIPEAATKITPQEKKLIRAAKKEGSVVFLNPSLKDPTVRQLEPAFIKHYGLGSGFKLKAILKGTGATVAMARQEIKANKFSFDVVAVASAGFFHAAEKKGAFLKLDSGQWKNHEELANKAGQFYRYPYFLAVMAYTFQPVWNVACPGMKSVNITSYSDIVGNPALRGKTLVSDVTKSTSYSMTTIGLMESGFNVKEMWRKLKATDPLTAFRTEAKMQLVVNCERPVDMWNLSGRAFQKIRAKPELAKALRWGTYKEGQVFFSHNIGVIKGAKHPNAGKLLVEFLLTKEGVDIVVANEISFYSFLKGYKPPASAKPYLMNFKKVKLIGLKDWVGASKKFKKMRAEWSKVFR